jgi:YegS/Rv2252/BmrU family lipid kinase
MINDQWLVVVNPNAGSGKCRKDWPQINEILSKKGFSYHVVFTQRRFHAILLIKKLINEGYRKVIVVGGDGTLNEVINGIFAQKACESESISVGMIPVGTGNDWARMFSIPSGYEEAIDTLLENNSIVMDAGRVNFSLKDQIYLRYFINIAGTGFDAIVARKTNQLKEKGKSGILLYFYNILSSLMAYKTTGISVEVDGKKFKDDIFSMSIGICRFNGGGMMQVPNADPTDGLFDITVIRKIGKFSVIRNLGRLYNGSIVKHSKVSALRGKNINIQASPPVYLETDGESLGHTPFQFSIIPASIKIIKGKKSNFTC